jgi:hypothetical protein
MFCKVKEMEIFIFCLEEKGNFHFYRKWAIMVPKMDF